MRESWVASCCKLRYNGFIKGDCPRKEYIMKTIGILCAMDSEFALIREALSGGHTESVGRQTFYLAQRGEKQIVAAVCGVGKVNAAACAQMMISHFHASCLINSGVAGALSSGLHNCKGIGMP